MVPEEFKNIPNEVGEASIQLIEKFIENLHDVRDVLLDLSIDRVESHRKLLYEFGRFLQALSDYPEAIVKLFLESAVGQVLEINLLLYKSKEYVSVPKKHQKLIHDQLQLIGKKLIKSEKEFFTSEYIAKNVTAEEMVSCGQKLIDLSSDLYQTYLSHREN